MEQLASEHGDPEQSASREQAARLARAIVLSLPEEKRMAFVLVELEGMSYAEAAETLDQSCDAVRARVRAARIEFSRQARRFARQQSGVGHVG